MTGVRRPGDDTKKSAVGEFVDSSGGRVALALLIAGMGVVWAGLLG